MASAPLLMQPTHIGMPPTMLEKFDFVTVCDDLQAK